MRVCPQWLRHHQLPLWVFLLSAVIWLHPMEEAPPEDLGWWVWRSRSGRIPAECSGHAELTVCWCLLWIRLPRLVHAVSAGVGLLHEAGCSQHTRDMLWHLDFRDYSCHGWLVLFDSSYSHEKELVLVGRFQVCFNIAVLCFIFCPPCSQG